MRAKILSIDSVAYEGEIKSVSVQTAAGRITVLPHHEAIVSALVPGTLSITDAAGTHKFALGGGVLRVENDSLVILADMAEEGGALDADAIEARRTKLAADIAAVRGSDKPEDIERLVAMEEDYLRESARLQATR
jgi:F-type H+-transporting ATPase subunit epsilon